MDSAVWSSYPKARLRWDYTTKPTLTEARAAEIRSRPQSRNIRARELIHGNLGILTLHTAAVYCLLLNSRISYLAPMPRPTPSGRSPMISTPTARCRSPQAATAQSRLNRGGCSVDREGLVGVRFCRRPTKIMDTSQKPLPWTHWYAELTGLRG